MGDHLLKSSLVFRPRTVGADFDLKKPSDELGEVGGPAAVPICSLRNLPVAILDMESKLPCWRNAGAMEFCNARAKLNRIRHIVGNVKKIAKKEMRRRTREFEFSPGVRLWNKSRDQLVYL